ncbi:MAG: hypothetical protein PHD29_02175 [bacterium]|nr:hypothetical protein [bacterium]MDD5353701.1 hypothetical protein [bacterium]MDD5755669.1 hypothetical protein [bacterium]
MKKSFIYCSLVFLICGCATSRVQDKLKIEELQKVIEQQENQKAEELQKAKEQQEKQNPLLDDIEILNAETGKQYIEIGPGERVKIKAIPHAYDNDGNDIGETGGKFNPSWSVKIGNVMPNTGKEVLYIAPYSFTSPNGYGWLVNTELIVSQENSEGKLVKCKTYIRFKVAADPTKE